QTAAACLGACVFLWLPWRTQTQPSIDFGDLSEPGRFVWFLKGGGYPEIFGDVGVWERSADLAPVVLAQLQWMGLVALVLGVGWAVRERSLPAAALALGLLGNIWFFFNYLAHDVEVFFLGTVAMLHAIAG